VRVVVYNNFGRASYLETAFEPVPRQVLHAEYLSMWIVGILCGEYLRNYLKVCALRVYTARNILSFSRGPYQGLLQCFRQGVMAT
jgi:hypothetical protein